jgi:hypothetical protein
MKKRYLRRRGPVAHIPRQPNLTLVMWNDATDEQKQVIRNAFFYIESRMEEGKFEEWLPKHGFYFTGFRVATWTIYDPEAVQS